MNKQFSIEWINKVNFLYFSSCIGENALLTRTRHEQMKTARIDPETFQMCNYTSESFRFMLLTKSATPKLK